jgi:hypothetical protein
MLLVLADLAGADTIVLKDGTTHKGRDAASGGGNVGPCAARSACSPGPAA